jgi:anti-anti-sigma regulatory factor
MTSMLIGTLVAMHRRLAERGQRLAACSPSPPLLALLQSSGINQFIRIYPDFPTTIANEDR